MRPGLDTRLRRLEAEHAASRAPADDETAAAAHTEFSEILSALAAEKAAGDTDGTAQRFIVAALAEVGRRA